MHKLDDVICFSDGWHLLCWFYTPFGPHHW